MPCGLTADVILCGFDPEHDFHVPEFDSGHQDKDASTQIWVLAHALTVLDDSTTQTLGYICFLHILD